MTNNDKFVKTTSYTGQLPNTGIVQENTAKTSSERDYIVIDQQEPFSSHQFLTVDNNDEVDEEIIKEISNINYKPILSSAL